MAIDYDKIFEKIKVSVGSDDFNSKDFLKMEIGSTVIGRLLIDPINPECSTEHYFWHSLVSRSAENKRFNLLCPNTFRQKCPFCARSAAMWKSDNPALKALSKNINRRETWCTNFYIISDNKHPENNGTVKILRYGFQLNGKIAEAQDGILKAIYGNKIWRLDEQGCNFMVNVVANSNQKDAWPSYTSSTFLPASKIEGMTDEKQSEILSKRFNLKPNLESKTYDELNQILVEHFLNSGDVPSISQPSQIVMASPITPSPAINNSKDEIDELDMSPSPTTLNATGAPVQVEGVAPARIDAGTKEVTDADLDAWMKEI